MCRECRGLKTKFNWVFDPPGISSRQVLARLSLAEEQKKESNNNKKKKETKTTTNNNTHNNDNKNDKHNLFKRTRYNKQ